jgi:uncharacterized protein (TIGR02001 family)
LRAAAVLLAAAGACATAGAQWGGTVAFTSDYRWRGQSLSDGRPSLRATLAFDDPEGWYAGASAAQVRLEPPRRGAEVLLYGGRTWPAGHALAAELGATARRFTAAHAYDYAEVHAGLIGRAWNARLHVAPDYYGSGTGAAYAELNLSRPLAGPWSWFGHAGVLVRSAHPAPPGRRSRADVRTGVAAAIGRYELQVSWVGVQRERTGAYDRAPVHRRSTLVLGASAAF